MVTRRQKSGQVDARTKDITDNKIFYITDNNYISTLQSRIHSQNFKCTHLISAFTDHWLFTPFPELIMHLF